jgi:hypothetical protein
VNGIVPEMRAPRTTARTLSSVRAVQTGNPSIGVPHSRVRDGVQLEQWTIDPGELRWRDPPPDAAMTPAA